MKLEIRKEIVREKNIFYNIYKDDVWVEDSTIYGGTINDDQTLPLEQINKIYDSVKQGLGRVIEIVKSEEI